MAIPANKSELREAITANYEKLRAELETIPAQLSTAKELGGHAKETVMSVSDLVSYLIGWGQLVLKWNQKKDQGEPVDFPETGYKWNELGKLAQKFYLDYKKLSYAELLSALDATVNAILQMIDKKTNSQLYTSYWYEDWTAGRLIQLNTASPYANAKARLRKWKKAKGIK